MPNWTPNWNNVQWDSGAAYAAADALDRAASKLDMTLQDRLRLAAEAQAEWRGPYRQQFDQELDQIRRGALALADDFRRTAGRIRAATRDAEAEQRRREAERERWHREKEAEERARRSRW